MNKTLKIKPVDKASRTLRDLYEAFPNKDEIPYHEYRLILKTFNYLFVKSMIESGKVYYIPGHLGVMGIFRVPVAGRGVFDYKLYGETGVKVWKKNLHSSSYTARFIWMLRYPRAILPKHILTAFKWEAPRFWKRYLAREIKEKNAINRYYDKHDY